MVPHHVLPNGMSVCCPTADQARKMFDEIFTHRIYLQHGLSASAGSTVIDVGANIGMFALFIACIAPGCQLHCFEPIPQTFAMLSETIRINGLDAKLYPQGLGKQVGVAEFTSYPRLNPLSTLFPKTLAELRDSAFAILGQEDSERIGVSLIDRYFLKHRSIECQIGTISTAIADAGLAQVDLLKIDTEGSELDILDGIAECDWRKISQIVMEIHDDRLLRACCDVLGAHGFTFSVDGDQLYMLYGRQADSLT